MALTRKGIQTRRRLLQEQVKILNRHLRELRRECPHPRKAWKRRKSGQRVVYNCTDCGGPVQSHRYPRENWYTGERF